MLSGTLYSMHRYYYKTPLKFDGFELIELRKSDTQNFKYDALIQDEKGQRWVYFGNKHFEQYKDSTPIRAYWD